jgi:hypothetical protein
VVRKQLIDLVANLHINLNGFDGPVPITVDEYNDFEEDVMRIWNAIHDNAGHSTAHSRRQRWTSACGWTLSCAGLALQPAVATPCCSRKCGAS